MRPEEICEQMRRLLTQANTIVARAPRYAAARGSIDRMLAQLGNMNGTFDGFSAADLTSAFADLRREANAARQTRAAIRDRRDTTRYTSAEKKAMQNLAALDDKLSRFDPLVRDFAAAEVQMTQYRTNYPANKNRHVASMRQLTATGMRPGYKDCESMKFPAKQEDRQQTHAAFIWLGMQHAKSYAAGAPEAAPAGVYTRAFDRMRDELRTAPPSCRARLARSLSQYEGYLLSEANKSLRKISGGRTNLSQQELAQAIRDPAITQAAAFANFRRALERDPMMAGYIRSARTETIGRDYAAVENVVGQVSSPELAGRPAIAQAVNDRRTALREDVNTGGFSVSSKEGKLCELYDRLGTLEEKGGTACLAMRTSLKKVIDERKLINENDPEFQKAMHDCERASRDYVTSHTKKPFSTRAKNRMAAADEMMRLSRGYTDAYAQEMENKAQAKLEKMDNSPDVANRIKLSKLQKVIAPVHTVPKVAKAVNTVSKYRSSGFGHAVAHVANAVVTNTFGLLYGAGAEIATHQVDKGTSKPLDTKHLPGGGKNDFYHDDVDENGLFFDRRKVPLVWSREIPEEPTSDIEFSIEVEQARDGSDIGSYNGNGFEEKNAVSDVEERYGHAFITLKYTQKDPLTGQPKRYKTSFGFYPDNTFLTTAQVANATQYGSSIVGHLSDDHGHDVSIGQTFKITPEQFNQVVTLAQNYEKGGYNILSRNCVTFAKDCVDAIGLDAAKDLFVETDLNSEALVHSAGIGAVPGLGVGYAVKAIAKNELYKLQDADGFTYQRYGQKLVSKEDLKTQDMVKYNKRAKGYSPGLLGEMMREKENIPLHTNKWAGTSSLQMEAIDNDHFKNSDYYKNKTNGREEEMSYKDKNQILKKVADVNRKKFSLLCLQEQYDQLKNKMSSLPDFSSSENLASLYALLDKMDAFSDNLTNAMDTAIANIDINNEKSLADNENEYQYKPVDYAKKKQAYQDLAKLCDTYTAGMNDIFRDTFRSDPRLNLEFGKVISFAERIKDMAAEEYPNFVREDRIGFDDLTMLEGELDTSRSALRSLYDAKCRNKNYFYKETLPNGTTKTYKSAMTLSPLEAYAAVKVYGSLENAVKLSNRADELNISDYIDMNKRYEAGSLKDKKQLVRDLGRSMETKLQRNFSPNAEDINVIFNHLPCSEKVVNGDNRTAADTYTNRNFASNALKGLVFEKFFGGFENEAKAFARSMRDPDAVDALTVEDREEQEVEFDLENGGEDFQAVSPVHRRKDFVNAKKAEMDEKMMKFILDKVNRDPETKRMFDKMKRETAKYLYYDTTGERYDPKKPGAIMTLGTFGKQAEARLVRDIIGTYLEPQLNYQLIREFKGPQATAQDKKMYERMGYLSNTNCDSRMHSLETGRYGAFKQEYTQARLNARQAGQQQPQNQPKPRQNVMGM